MEITPIQYLAGLAGIVIFLTIFLGRVVRQHEAYVEHAGCAAVAALSAFGAIKAAYPLYRFARFRSLANIENFYEYVLIGCGIALATALFAIVKLWNYRMQQATKSSTDA